ncbi:MAG: hypothetical protein M1813_001307 [Trichoglossum hirsutum]|nr:MAG: hypothetical protein M1813_001307 [Trichoglossum hirsutum]
MVHENANISIVPGTMLEVNTSSKQENTSLGNPASMWHDWKIHHPLGAGSYAFRDTLFPSILRVANISADVTIPAKPVIVHCGYQPNNSPHIGTMAVLALSFQLARKLKDTRSGNLNIVVHADMVDTAPDNGEDVKVGRGFQRSLRYTGAINTFHSDYVSLLDMFSQLSSIPYKETSQADLCKNPYTPTVIHAIIKDRHRVGPELSPETGHLAVRASCPDCGITDKHGIQNVYDDDKGIIEFQCPQHGAHTINIYNPLDAARLEFNTPLRNLVRELVYASDNSVVHLRVTGADYAGQYQEQLLFRQWPFLAQYDGDVERVKRTPIHIYAPLTVDWAGSKLSKSLYVAEGAYAYLRDQSLDYLLSLKRMKEIGKDPRVVWDEVGSWIVEPKKLFRSYSVEYWHMVFMQAETAEDRTGFI